MSTTSRTSPISSPPGQEDQSARLAASAEVGQVEGTTLYWYRNEYKTSTGVWLVSGFSMKPDCFPVSGFDAVEWRSVPCIGFDMGQGA